MQFNRIANLPANATAAERQDVRQRVDLRIGALGSGSDYSRFIDHLGVASLNLGFGGEDKSAGVYHSVYDDFYWYTHFADSDFVYGRALAQTAGTAIMRLADSDLLPYDFSDFTDTIHRYLDEVKKLAADLRDQIMERNRRIDEGLFAAIDDPQERMVPPVRETESHFLTLRRSTTAGALSSAPPNSTIRPSPRHRRTGVPL